MVCDYLVEMPCEPKRRLSEDGLVERLRLLERVRFAERLTPDCAAAARQAMFDLQPLAFHCSRCPANAAGQEFGCYGCIHDPLSLEAEEWLASRLPLTLNEKHAEEAEEARQMERVRELAEWLRSAGLTGQPADELRKEGLFLRPKQMARTYGPFYRRRRVGTSQLLEMMLLRERLEPQAAELLCRALGVWQEGGAGEDGLPEALFTQPVSDADDQPTADLKQFFLALMTACSLDVPVSTCLKPPDPAALHPVEEPVPDQPAVPVAAAETEAEREEAPAAEAPVSG